MVFATHADLISWCNFRYREIGEAISAIQSGALTGVLGDPDTICEDLAAIGDGLREIIERDWRFRNESPGADHV